MKGAGYGPLLLRSRPDFQRCNGKVKGRVCTLSMGGPDRGEDGSRRMLQPSQLQEVSARFPAEIAEVRAFLLRAGVPVDTRDALHDAVLRLDRDKGFHRDLGSHVWLLLYSGAGVQEVLQVVALAAGGVRNAAAAQEEDAHAILGFVLAERRAFLRSESREQSVPAVEQPATVAPAPAAPAPARAVQAVEAAAGAESTTREMAEEPAPNRARTVFASAAEKGLEENGAAAPPQLPRKSRRVMIAGRLIAVFVCLIGLGIGGWWMYRESHDVEPSWTTSVEDKANVTTLPPASPSTMGTVSPTTEKPVASSKFHFDQLFRKRPPAPVVDTHAGPLPNASDEVSSSTLPTPSAAPPATPSESTAAPIVRVPAGSSPAVVNSARPLIPSGVVAAKPPAPPVPTAVLANRLGSPSANAADAVDDRVAGTRGYPRLLRRKSLLADGTLVAGNSAPPSIGGANPTSARIPSGTVRSTALGITAGNLVYAPDPAYPAAAAQQRVSGQVTVQAMVDREGNVASARVVSGPPLLRDAAVNAVQRWRFKPFLNGGKPQTFTSIAVVDFQLQ